MKTTKLTYAQFASNKAVSYRLLNLWMPLLLLTMLVMLYGEYLNTSPVMQPDPTMRWSTFGLKF